MTPVQRQYSVWPSHRLVLALAVMHGAAWISLLLLPLPVWADVILFILLAANFLCLLHQSLTAPVAIKLDGDRVIVEQRNGSQIAGKVLPDSIVMPPLTIVNFLPDDSRIMRSVVILPDSLDADAYRQLRVGLTWR